MTFEVLNAIRLSSPRCRFIFLSSAAVYGNPDVLLVKESDALARPLSPYGYHKLQGEIVCDEFSKIYGMNTASVRIFSAYGPGLRRQVIWDIYQKSQNDKHFILQGTGDESRDFIHAIDIANAIGCIATHAPMEGEAYNVANGFEVKIRDLAEMVLSNVSYQGTLEFDGIIPRGVPRNWCSDISKVNRLGFEPVIPLNRGVENFIKWAELENGKS